MLPGGVRRIRRGRGRFRRPVANDRSGSICHLLRLRQPTDAVCIVQNQRKYKARTVWAGGVPRQCNHREQGAGFCPHMPARIHGVGLIKAFFECTGFTRHGQPLQQLLVPGML